MTKKHATDMSLQFMSFFLAGFTLLGFYFFVVGLQTLSKFNVMAGGSMIFLGALALYYYTKIASKLK